MTNTIFDDWHVIGADRDFPAGTVKSVRLLGRDLVAWCGADGHLRVWDDRCPHRGAKLSGGKIEDNTLICPYHGLAYDIGGHCIRIPAHPDLSPPARMRSVAYATQPRYGLWWVCLGNPEAAEIPPFPEWDDRSYRKFLCDPYTYCSSGLRAIENFLDVSHFPFIHDGFLGDRHHTTVSDYQVNTDEMGLELRDVRVWQPDPDGTGNGGEVTYNYRVWRPLVASFVKQSPSGCLAIFFAVTPVEEELCLGWMWIAMNYGWDLPESELRQFQDTVVRQDIPIVESQVPRRLPLDLRAEVHLPCDRASIAYRQWLSSLGVCFGAI
ncbi:MAG TPA: aromatic ring-hydroxylating dioxygenase subunit alpha [Oscillatoriales cyanobacterium M59_W2019_021]|nr:aromatic ring-hydroxylating dioxygenase subunit alpha [Oscillatoriales cyanobacterium M59_W2019_021]